MASLAWVGVFVYSHEKAKRSARHSPMAKNIPRTGKNMIENRLQRQAVSLRPGPQTKPETCENSRPLVLPGLPQGGSVMANPKKRVPENVPGDFFVDSTCIDCDACRQIAPSVFGEAAETSFVKAQPVSSTDRRQALQALLACPTGSIGCLGDDDVKAVMKDFPLVIEEPVYYCGYNSPKSYGGNSYFIRHAEGNWLIDSPKFVTPAGASSWRRSAASPTSS